MTSWHSGSELHCDLHSSLCLVLSSFIGMKDLNNFPAGAKGNNVVLLLKPVIIHV